MDRRLLKQSLLWCLSSLLASQAWALQQITIKPGGVATAKIAATAPTRIAIAGGRISRILGGEGKVTGYPDKEAGDAYITPTAAYRQKAFSLFVKDDQGHVVSLLLTPVDTPSETIEITIAAVQQSEYPGDNQQASAWEGVEDYEATLVALISQMALRQVPEGYGYLEINRKVPLWKETKVTLVSRYQGTRLVGEVYRLTNKDKKTMRLAEQEFLRPGVLAVAIEQHELPGGGSTRLFIVSAAAKPTIE